MNLRKLYTFKMAIIIIFICLFFVPSAPGQVKLKGLPSLPTSGQLGIQGSIGAGFVDYNIENPKGSYLPDRGQFFYANIERGFGAHFYLSLGLGYLASEGTAQYRYSNLSSSTSYSVNDISFKSSVVDLSLGLKFKLIDQYWFRPYIEGGGIGSYHQLSYTNKLDTLAGQGSDYKKNDIVMGSGYYGEAGLEAMFSEQFGIKIAARQSHYDTKKLVTLNNLGLRYLAETYFFSLLFGF